MARKKTITRNQILNATYEVIRTEGFSGFTARNIASKMKCSTQPIYLEFKNMTDLKSAVLKKTQVFLDERIFDVQSENHSLVDANLLYIHFAEVEPTFFKTLFIEGHEGCEMIERFMRQRFMDMIEEDPDYVGLDQKVKDDICTELWVISTGIACLRSGQMIGHTDEEIRAFLKMIIDRICEE